MMTDPRHCGFDPADLPRCAGDRPGEGLRHRRAARRDPDRLRRPDVERRAALPGFNYGGESAMGGWPGWVVGPPGAPSAQYGFGTELFKYFVFGDPDWDYTGYDFSTWQEDVAPTAAILNATDTDLSRFRDGGGRIIYWTGWSDLALTPLGTIDYYVRLAADDAAARDYARLYMLPGVLHCAGGPGPDRVDWVEAIRAWVEDGRAPERLLATKLGGDDEVTMTRPVCPYPQVAVYDGSGDPNDEASFACAIPSL